MTKDSTIKLLFILLLGSSSSLQSAVVMANDDPQQQQQQQLRSTPSSSQSSKKVRTLMCTTESCTDATVDTPGCKEYTTPLETCYNAQTLFPGDESWSDLDIYDTMMMRNLKRTFYESKDGSCGGREEEEDGHNIPQAVDGDDTFILPIGDCVGPFGPPRPWGKFTLLEDGVLSEE
eukprot:CAMPEP_0201667566 /NCGR_PEP_ID=MMETSP0494-20130426/15616_1 /ASSEMBLY_ACC=CAM_ASM_000839 /TAXON_ID=420259 /ORGANISM="Thalassiosira gravida, Strain GMp14c1" /LENGTH=175 /DNA_ID=CAMNT_0048147597 /DNA_START=8 /DNA_END=535 /DNA_ORIENTATION=-